MTTSKDPDVFSPQSDHCKNALKINNMVLSLFQTHGKLPKFAQIITSVCFTKSLQYIKSLVLPKQPQQKFYLFFYFEKETKPLNYRTFHSTCKWPSFVWKLHLFSASKMVHNLHTDNIERHMFSNYINYT